MSKFFETKLVLLLIILVIGLLFGLDIYRQLNYSAAIIRTLIWILSVFTTMFLFRRVYLYFAEESGWYIFYFILTNLFVYIISSVFNFYYFLIIITVAVGSYLAYGSDSIFEEHPKEFLLKLERGLILMILGSIGTAISFTNGFERWSYKNYILMMGQQGDFESTRNTLASLTILIFIIGLGMFIYEIRNRKK